MMAKIIEVTRTNHKSIGLACLVLAIVLQSHYKYSIPILGTDNMWQLMSAKALWEGHGISIISPDTNDLSQKVYTRQVHWAPGVPIVVSPLFYLTGQDVIITEWLFTVFGLILFFLSWYYMLRLLKPYLDDLLLPALMLFSAFAFVPQRSLGLSDVLSLASFSVALYFTLKLLLSSSIGTGRAVLYVTIASVCAFLSCFFRYAYYAIAVSIPAILFFYGLLRHRKYLKYAVLSAIIIGALIIPQFQFMLSAPSQAPDEDLMESIDKVHKNKVTSAVRWELLQHLDHIFTNGFFPEWVIKKFFGSDGLREPESTAGILFLALLSAFMGILLIFGLIKLIRGIGRTIVPQDNWNSISGYLSHPVIVFLVVAWIAIAANVGMLTYLELRYTDEYTRPYYGYLNYTRYFAVTITFIQVIAFILLFSKNLIAGKFYKKMLGAVLLASFIFNVAHWSYIKMKFSWSDYVSNLGYMKVPEGSPADYFRLQQAVAENELPVVFMGNNTDSPELLNPKYRNKFIHVFAAVAGASMSNFQTILNSKFRTSKPLEIWIPISIKEPEQVLIDFCSANNAVKKITLPRAGFDIMSITVQPNQIMNGMPG